MSVTKGKYKPSPHSQSPHNHVSVEDMENKLNTIL